jgi:hypothetical protein
MKNMAYRVVAYSPQRIMSPYYRFIPSDTELFPLTVGHNVNLNKLQTVLIVL